MRTCSMTRRRTARGAVAVEMALVAPLLLLLVLGCIEWGYFFFVENVVVNCTREAARAGSIAPDDASVGKWATDALDNALLQGSLVPARKTVDVQIKNDLTYGKSVQVTVSYSTSSLSGARFIPLPTQAWARAEMRR